MTLDVQDKSYRMTLSMTEQEIRQFIDEADAVYMKFPPDHLPMLNELKNTMALMLANQ